MPSGLSAPSATTAYSFHYEGDRRIMRQVRPVIGRLTAVEQNRERPFFLMLSTQAPHTESGNGDRPLRPAPRHEGSQTGNMKT